MSRSRNVITHHGAGAGDCGSAGGPSLARLNGFASPASRGIMASPAGMSAATAGVLHLPGCSPGGLRWAGLDFGCCDSFAGLWDDLPSHGSGGNAHMMAMSDIFNDAATL